jgi:hypothetical protein
MFKDLAVKTLIFCRVLRRAKVSTTLKACFCKPVFSVGAFK